MYWPRAAPRQVLLKHTYGHRHGVDWSVLHGSPRPGPARLFAYSVKTIDLLFATRRVESRRTMHDRVWVYPRTWQFRFQQNTYLPRADARLLVAHAPMRPESVAAKPMITILLLSVAQRCTLELGLWVRRGSGRCHLCTRLTLTLQAALPSAEPDPLCFVVPTALVN